MRSTELLRQQRERMQSVPGTSPATIFVLGGGLCWVDDGFLG